MKNVSHLLPALLLAACAHPVAVSSPGPVTLTQRITAITAPLRPDGTPDYVAALNAHYSLGVTAENNAAAALYRIVGSAEISAQVRDETLRQMGINPTQVAGKSFPDYFLWLTEHLRLPPNTLPEDRYWNQFDDALKRPWQPAQFPELAAYLQLFDSQLNAAAFAADLPRCWIPIIETTPGGGLGAVPFSPGSWNSIADTLLARAMLSLGNHDPESFSKDALVASRLAHLSAQEPATIQWLNAARIDRDASTAIAAAAATGLLPAETLHSLRRALGGQGPLPPVADTINLAERWQTLDGILLFARPDQARHTHPALFPHDHPQMAGDIAGWIDQSAIDRNRILGQVNQGYDQQVAQSRQTIVAPSLTIPALIKGLNDLRGALAALTQENLQRKPGELPDAYTDRIAPMLLNITYSDWSLAASIQTRTILVEHLRDAALAVALYKAEHGAPPATLSALVPQYLNDIPNDPYSPGGKSPVLYVIRNDTFFIYSVGPNAKDEQGLSIYKDGRDDISVGDVPVAKSP